MFNGGREERPLHLWLGSSSFPALNTQQPAKTPPQGKAGGGARAKGDVMNARGRSFGPLPGPPVQALGFAATARAARTGPGARSDSQRARPPFPSGPTRLTARESSERGSSLRHSRHLASSAPPASQGSSPRPCAGVQQLYGSALSRGLNFP